MRPMTQKITTKDTEDTKTHIDLLELILVGGVAPQILASVRLRVLRVSVVDVRHQVELPV